MRYLLLLLCLACACSDTDPLRVEQGAFRELSLHGGCGDLTMFAVRPDDEEGFRSIYLEVSTSGLLARAIETRGPQEITIALPHTDVTVELVTGEELGGPCSDYSGKHEVHDVYQATSGRAEIVVTPDLDPDPEADRLGRGTVRLDDVILESDGDAIEIDGFVIEDVVVGTSIG